MRVGMVALIFALGFATNLAFAAGAPAQLRGESVVVTWSETRVQRTIRDPPLATGHENSDVYEFHTVNDTLALNVYISTEGRIFSRLTHNVGRGSGATEEIAGTDGASRVFDFRGAAMSAIEAFKTGAARRVVVEFDKGFASCAAKAMYAKQTGVDLGRYWSPIIRKYIEIQSSSVGDATCSVRDGNVFGGNN